MGQTLGALHKDQQPVSPPRLTAPVAPPGTRNHSCSLRANTILGPDRTGSGWDGGSEGGGLGTGGDGGEAGGAGQDREWVEWGEASGAGQDRERVGWTSVLKDRLPG